MINAKLKDYDYFTFGDLDEYGQPALSTAPQGTVKIAIHTLNTTVTDNIKYKEATYIGLTLNSLVNDSWVIKYGDIKLKVLYVNPEGRLKQVFLKEI
jgi:hypothetical protein